MKQFDARVAWRREGQPCRPAIAFAGAQPSQDRLDALHREAHAPCDIAHSLETGVAVMEAR
ncbi:hypothetical protein [uncultured Massilia sp.]|uniref:hypothetical protein n=1 Tax=uncultured Massilia sp. TaxID=169973 RepID=UPI00258ED330|nr:hypothetical protein [uncultured Massilia sp.]